MRIRPILLLVQVLLVGTAWLMGCAQHETRTKNDIRQVRVIASYPHDTEAFTQGLTVHDKRMYEGTGRYGASSLRCVDIETGTVERMVSLSNAYFGEGITVFKNRLYQFTWRNNIAFVYDPDTFTVLETLLYDREAWGVTDDGAHLIVSDGTATIRFLDPETLQPVKYITAHAGPRMVDRLNELEYVRGEIWANIWFEDSIVRISPVDGNVLGWIDLSELYPNEERGKEDVLNGIAFDAISDRLFVTGKNWPNLYEIEIAHP